MGLIMGLIAGLIIIGLIPIIGLVLMPIMPMEGDPRSFLATPAAVAGCSPASANGTDARQQMKRAA